MLLDGKVAIVTGAGRGIGEAIAVRLSLDGARVVVADIEGELAQAVARQIDPSGQKALPLTCDVTDDGSVRALVDRTIGWGGGIDILVNNAGIMRRGNVWEMDPSDFESVVRVNLMGPFLCIRRCALVMKERGGGTIVNIASIHSFATMAEMSAYAASKTGLIGLTRASAIDLGPWNIRVIAVCPGAVDAPMLHSGRTVEEADRIKEQWSNASPLNRIVSPQEIADLVALLCSGRLPSFTGAAILIDAGVSVDLRVR